MVSPSGVAVGWGISVAGIVVAVAISSPGGVGVCVWQLEIKISKQNQTNNVRRKGDARILVFRIVKPFL